MRWQKGPFYSGDVGDFWHPILNICHILDIAGENRQFRHNRRSPRAGTFFAIIASPLAKMASLQEATFGIQFKSPEACDFSLLHAFLDLSVKICYDHVLTSGLPGQHNDAITFFTCLCISRYKEFLSEIA